jgi:exodeoxyribonuclease-3
MPTIASWNINSLRLRLPLLKKFSEEARPDIICLQETKVKDEDFPLDAVKALGYPHVAFRGEKSYNGVAILSKIPLSMPDHHNFGGKGDTRHLKVLLPDGVELHNFYVPAGGDEPDPVVNLKFAHKLQFVEDMTAFFAKERSANDNIIIVGDMNIAPLEHDVWSHKQLLKIVSHTPPEVERMEALRASLGWVDAHRHFIPANQKLYSWWSYRNQDWEKSDRGRRLDHIWMTKGPATSLQNSQTLRHMRNWEQPSDHVPILAMY